MKPQGRVILAHWMENLKTDKRDNSKYRKYRVNLAKRAEVRERRKMFVARGYEPREDVDAGPHAHDPQIVDCYIYYRMQKAGWHLARVMGVQENAELQSRPHTLRMLDLRKRYNIHLLVENLKTSRKQVTDWCWHHRVQRRTSKYFAHTL